MKTKRYASLLCVFILIFSLAAGLSSCGKPKVGEIYDRVVELVEGSYEINTVFYGAGLPVYATDSEHAKINRTYYNFEHNGYEVVKAYSKFLSDEQIKERAEQVYSMAYLEEVLYTQAFVGYATDDGTGNAIFSASTFIDDGQWLYQANNKENYLRGMRIYDYSTMRVLPQSNDKACYVEMSSWLENDPMTVTTVKLRLLKQDGEWFLDSFTG